MTFSIFNDPTKPTNGRRFWSQLAIQLKRKSNFNETSSRAVFFNISAPFKQIIHAKLTGRKIINRLGGIYHEKLTNGAIDAMEHLLPRLLMRLIYRLTGPSTFGGLLMNLLRHNYKLLLKMQLADILIFQSDYSRRLWWNYAKHKSHTVILNGAPFHPRRTLPDPNSPIIHLMTTYDPWRPAKRLNELVRFVRWYNKSHNLQIELLIIGYDSNSYPINLSLDDRQWIERGESVKIWPVFTHFSPDLVREIERQHGFITFSICDNCPSSVIEAMSFGLPVLALNSGGLPEIVGGAGEIIPLNSELEPFCSFDHSFDYPTFHFSNVAVGLQKILLNYKSYCMKVERRFREELSIELVAKRYLNVITSFAREPLAKLQLKPAHEVAIREVPVHGSRQPNKNIDLGLPL